MEQLLDRVVIPDSFADALLHRSGIYGPFLDLVVSVEGGDLERIENLTGVLMLSAGTVNEAHLRALTWVEQLGID